jgi:FKBP-type peptidyl-prolyl cis-trans isomerase FkpA
MNFAVGSRENTSPMERRGRNPFTVTGVVSGLIAAALMSGATLVNAQNGAAPAAAPATAPATPATAKKAAGTGTKSAAGAKKEDTSPKAQGSYAIGVSVGENLARAKVSSQQVSVEKIAQGIHDSLDGKAKMSQEYQSQIMALIQGAHLSAAEPNHKAAATFLAENGKKPDIKTTASGLQYKVLSAGSGDSPKPTDQVSVNYTGKLLDGTVFDASEKHGGPATFPVNGVIPGWTEALQLMKPGAKFQLWIPPKLAYDVDSPPTIPPGSLLVFDVELVSIKPPAPAAAPPPGAPGAGAAMHPAVPPPK